MRSKTQEQSLSIFHIPFPHLLHLCFIFAFPQPPHAETNVDQNLHRQTTTWPLLQDFWILRLWFCDDRDLSGSPVGNPPPAGTQSQHKEDQVGQSLIGGSLRKNFVVDLKER